MSERKKEGWQKGRRNEGKEGERGGKGGRKGKRDVPLLSVKVVAALDDLTPVSVRLLAESLVLDQAMVTVGKKEEERRVRKTGRLMLPSILPPCLFFIPPALLLSPRLCIRSSVPPSLPPFLTFSSFMFSTASRWEENSSSDKVPSSASRK